jgi:NADH pyrophosphatase NudC (nudix superfamily)
MTLNNIFIFARPGRIALLADSASDDGVENGIAFDEHVKHDFGAELERGLFVASDPDGKQKYAALLLPTGTDETKINPRYTFQSIRSFIGDFAYNRILRLYHIAQWQDESKYCGSCGALNESIVADEYAKRCPQCGRKEFPRISPAVIVLITNDKGEALLAHNVHFQNNIYSLIAGFVEAGENLENAVAREIREEIGLEVGDITFVTSQNWPFPNSLMVGFTARYKSGAIQCDNNEISDAQWFSRNALPELPAHGSISRYIINQWLNNAN